MKVTYPFSKLVYKSDFRGNLAETYSKIQQSEVIGNLCPYCRAYQGNWFVEDDGLMENAYDLEKFVVGFIEIKVSCLACGKELTDEYLGKELFDRVEPSRDYLEAEELYPEEKRDFYKYRIENLVPFWFCETCLMKIGEEDRLQRIRDGPVIKCPLCGKNTKDNPETEFQEHHLSYVPEIKMIVCLNCHLKIHNSDAFPNLKPKDKRQPDTSPS